MATKDVGIQEAVFKRLEARKRQGESFSDLIARLLDESQPSWREGFGTLESGQDEKMRRAVDRSRRATSLGLTASQRRALEHMADVTKESDEGSDTQSNGSDSV